MRDAEGRDERRACKESRKWLVSYDKACTLQTACGTHTTVVSVGDREADMYELFCDNPGAEGQQVGSDTVAWSASRTRSRRSRAG